jgi:hypothetical protein
MTVENDTTETENEWQFGDWPEAGADAGGGGLLRQILDEVTAMRAAAAADRVALAEAISGSLAKFDSQLAHLRDDVAAVRAELDSSGRAVAHSLAEFLAKAEADGVDVARVAAEIRHLRVSLIGQD